MLRLPAALVEDISLRSGALSTLSLTCTALWRVLNQPETQLRFYLAARRRSCSTSHTSNGSRSSLTDVRGSSFHHCSSTSRLDSVGVAGFGPFTVYGLLCCRARPRDEQGALRLLQLMLSCSSMVQLVPEPYTAPVQHMLAATSSRDASRAVDLLSAVLPHAEHCLLHFAAASGHLQLVKLLLPRNSAPVQLHGVLHYRKSSAFLAAAAGGHVCVLSALLAAGACRWACQLPGASLTSTALDLAALGGHMEAMQLLGQLVANPSPYFLTAAADSGSGPAMEWALKHWFTQFSAITAFSRAHVAQMHDALKVSSRGGHVAAVRQLLAALHRINNEDCGVLALTYASSTSNTAAIQAVLDSPQLTAQLSRGGPKLLSKLAQAVASCMRIAILKHCRPALDTLLQHLTSTSSPIAAVRPLLAPHMRFIFDQAAQSGNAAALQLLLLMLPEHYEALGVSALEAALSEGHAEVAATLSTLLIMQGPDPAAAAAALSPEGNAGLAQASLHGAYKGACVRGDLPALQSLLQQGPDGQGPDDNMQLLLLRLAAGAGKEEAVRLLLGEFGGVGPRLEANLKAVCRGAVHAGQLQLLQSLASDRPRSSLLAHISSQPEALAEYLRAALLCGQVDVAAWLVLLASEQQEVELVRSTLSSLLATSRWELLNAGKGVVMHEVVFDLLARLAAHALAASEDSTERCSDSSSSNSSTGSNSSSTSAVQPADPEQPLLQDEAAASAAASSTSAQGAGGGVAAARRTALHNLGRELLQPQLLGQLLHVAQGLGPWRLLTLVELVDWWGLGAGPQQQQQQQEERAEVLGQQPTACLSQQPAGQQVQPMEEGDLAQQVGASAGAAAGVQQLGRASLEQQQQQLSVQLKQRHTSSEDDSAALRDNLPVPRSSSGASLSSSGTANGSSSSVTSSCNGSGDAACDIVSPCVTQPGSGPAARRTCGPSGGLVTGNSMEVGSLSSDGCPATQNWLDDLLSKAAPSSSNSSPAAAAPDAQQQQQQAQLQLQRQQLQLHVQQPQSPASPGEQKQLDLGKEWGGSWQQLTGQVAQLHMTSPQARTQQQQQQHAALTHTRVPRQSFDYEQHVVQALRRQAQAGCDHLRRESAPGPARSTTAAAGARQLRSALSQTPLVSAPRCPVHPYMQQLASTKQQPQQQ